MADKPKVDEPEIAYFDKDMKPCPKESAHHAHVISKDEDGEEIRHWLELKKEAKP